MKKGLLGGYLIAIGCIWLICAYAATPQVMLGIVCGFLLLWLFRQPGGAR